MIESSVDKRGSAKLNEPSTIAARSSCIAREAPHRCERCPGHRRGIQADARDLPSNVPFSFVKASDNNSVPQRIHLAPAVIHVAGEEGVDGPTVVEAMKGTPARHTTAKHDRVTQETQ